MSRGYYNDDEIDLPNDQDPYQLVYDTEIDYISDDENTYNEQNAVPLYELTKDSDTEDDKNIIQFSEIKIGITMLIVSNNGIIRKANDIFSSSMGFALIGTPYRTYIVEIKENQYEEYFVHDLVWRAFNGEPPEGWEVRHKFWEAKRCAEYYDNSLDSLDIYPSTVIYMPSMRECLPCAD